MEWLADELRKRGYPGSVKTYASPAELGRELAGLAKAGDALLFKGSNSMKMVEAWNAYAAATGLAKPEAGK